jgi:hypothetical protein
MKHAAWAAGLGLLVACYPGGAETVRDLDTVTTQHDPKADYSTIRTYALPSTIQETRSPVEDPLPIGHAHDAGVVDPRPIDHSHDAAILGTVAANLDALGWQQVDPATTTPDVEVLVSFTVTRYLEYVSYPFYSWYPGWAGFSAYDATWGVYYPWVHPGTYATIIDSGSLRMEMLDVRTPDSAAKQLTAIWTASLDGILDGSGDSLLGRITHGIDQAFAQSPYL